MAAILEQMRMWAEQVVRVLGYPGISVMMFVENIFPPIPSEVVMPFAGFLVDKGELTFVGILAAGTLGAVVGALVIYYLGRWVGESTMRVWFRSYGHWLLMSERDFDQALAVFNRNGRKMVLIGRLIPGVRSLISLPAGIDRMNPGTFLLFTVLGTLVWNAILGYAGVLLGGNWQRVLDFISQYEIMMWGILVLAALLFVVRRLRRPA